MARSLRFVALRRRRFLRTQAGAGQRQRNGRQMKTHDGFQLTARAPERQDAASQCGEKLAQVGLGNRPTLSANRFAQPVNRPEFPTRADAQRAP